VNFRTIKSLMAMEPAPIPSLVGDQDTGLLIPQGKLIIFGRWGTWKSMMSMDLGFKMAFGRPWLGFDTVRSRVAILQVEIPEAIMRERVAKYQLGHNITNYTEALSIASEPFYRVGRDPRGQLDAWLSTIQPRVLILDPITKMIDGDISSSSDAHRLLELCDVLSARHKLAIVLIGHIRKPNLMMGNEPGSNGAHPGPVHPIYPMEHELIGSSVFADWADTLISVQNQTDTELLISFEKVRHSHILLNDMSISVSRKTLQFQVTDYKPVEYG
jgi:hypothetical protein